jgi:hypothetical protein
MKKCFICFLPLFVLFLASSIAGHADTFSEIQNSPHTYWVPAPTPPPPGYVAGPYYYAPPPPGYYYGPPPPPAPPVVIIPRFFFGFRFH